MKLGLALSGKLDGDEAKSALDMIKNAGFDATFLCYDKNHAMQELADYCKKIGLEIDNIHAHFTRTPSGCEKDLNSMWEDGDIGDNYLKTLMECVDFCKANGVGKCVLHNAVATTPPPVSDVGINRFAKLFDYAKQNGVRFAVENLESLTHLKALMDLGGDYHGFCWDTGHNICYTPMCDVMELYGDRLLVTHINSNIGITRAGYIHYTDDLHLLPFDGSLDCEWAAKKIKAHGFSGTLMFELKPQEHTDSFYKEAYSRAKRFDKFINC